MTGVPTGVFAAERLPLHVSGGSGDFKYHRPKGSLKRQQPLKSGKTFHVMVGNRQSSIRAAKRLFPLKGESLGTHYTAIVYNSTSTTKGDKRLRSKAFNKGVVTIGRHVGSMFFNFEQKVWERGVSKESPDLIAQVFHSSIVWDGLAEDDILAEDTEKLRGTDHRTLTEHLENGSKLTELP